MLYAVALYLEHHFCAFAATYPVALHFLEGFRPVQAVQAFQQAGGIGAYAQLPLGHLLLEYGKTTALAKAVLNLVVGKYGSECRAPVNGAFSLICNAVAHKRIGLFLFGESFPILCGKGGPFAAGSINGGGTTLFKGFDQFLYRTGFLKLIVIPAAEHLEESPLGPLVVIRITGAEFAVPVEGETNAVQLLPVAGHVAVRSLFRVLAGLDGILLGRKTEGIVTHGVQHVETLQALVTRKDVAGYISKRMANMQARAAGVREHVKHIILGFI